MDGVPLSCNDSALEIRAISIRWEISRELASRETGAIAFCSVPANLAVGWNKRQCRLRSAIAGGKGVQQGENAGIGESDSEDDRSGDGKDHYGGGQQTPHVRPTFP
jgi:hypothetical protein